MILFINTSDFKKLQLALISLQTAKEFTATLAFNENYRTNELLQKFLSKNKLAPQDITKVFVCSGPGSFTGIRVGVSLAQALGFALQIPVVLIPQNKIPPDLLKLTTFKISEKNLVHYGQKPNIGKIKKTVQ